MSWLHSQQSNFDFTVPILRGHCIYLIYYFKDKPLIKSFALFYLIPTYISVVFITTSWAHFTKNHAFHTFMWFIPIRLSDQATYKLSEGSVCTWLKPNWWVWPLHNSSVPLWRMESAVMWPVPVPRSRNKPEELQKVWAATLIVHNHQKNMYSLYVLFWWNFNLETQS